MNGRNTVLGGQRPHTGNAAQLQAVDMALRTVSNNLFLFHTLSRSLYNRQSAIRDTSAKRYPALAQRRRLVSGSGTVQLALKGIILRYQEPRSLL